MDARSCVCRKLRLGLEAGSWWRTRSSRRLAFLFGGWQELSQAPGWAWDKDGAGLGGIVSGVVLHQRISILQWRAACRFLTYLCRKHLT